MVKHVITWSYWLGVLFAVLTLLTRALNILGVAFLLFFTRGVPITYFSYFDAASLIFSSFRLPRRTMPESIHKNTRPSCAKTVEDVDLMLTGGCLHTFRSCPISSLL